jgi:hypothetical protein
MADLPDVDLTPLIAAMKKGAEEVVRAVMRDMVPSLLTQQVEESLKIMVPSLVEAAVAQEKAHIEETVKTMVPSLIEAAVAQERVLIEETAQEVTRKALPDLLRPLVQQLAEEIIEKVARDVVGAKAEAEVKKEIERLTAEA